MKKFDKILFLFTAFMATLLLGFLWGFTRNLNEVSTNNKHYLHIDTVYVHNCDSAIALYLKHHGFTYPAPFLWWQPDTIQTKLLNDPINWKYSTKAKVK